MQSQPIIVGQLAMMKGKETTRSCSSWADHEVTSQRRMRFLRSRC